MVQKIYIKFNQKFILIQQKHAMKNSTTTKSQTPGIYQSQPFGNQYYSPQHNHSHQTQNFSQSRLHYGPNPYLHSQSHMQPSNAYIQPSPKVSQSFQLPSNTNYQDRAQSPQLLANYESRVSKKNHNKIEFFEEVAYKIAPAEEDKLALDVRTKDGLDEEDQKGNLILFDYHGGPNQNFYLKKVGENEMYCKYNIINAATGFTLEVPDDSRQSIQLHMDPRNNGESEIWELVPYPGGLFKIRSFCGKVLHADSTFLRNETRVIQEVEQKEKKQLWKIIPC